MVEANGLIYVCGGSLGNNVSGRVLNSCEVYDPATETWTELCPMLEARKNHGLVFVKDKIFAVGGQNGLGGLDNVEYYDIKMNEWKMVSPMPWKGVTVKCAAVGSIVYVLAGFQGCFITQLESYLSWFPGPKTSPPPEMPQLHDSPGRQQENRAAMAPWPPIKVRRGSSLPDGPGRGRDVSRAKPLGRAPRSPTPRSRSTDAAERELRANAAEYLAGSASSAAMGPTEPPSEYP
ncbi:UNVERIFIED_CONTAM: hypothetical protein K2H54_038795 [Gekko kuhli]